MSRERFSPRLFATGGALALLLGLLPLPEALAPLRPWWLALVLAYWVLETPEHVGLGVAFVLGLAGDLVYGTLLGEHALRLTMMTFILMRFRARLRFFPLWQQALAMLALLANDRVVVLMVRAFTGEGLPPWDFWLAPAVGALVWPWLFLLLDDLRLRARGRDA